MRTRSAGRRQEILGAAQALLIKQGYEGMTMKTVAERAGAAMGSVTHFFEKKQALAAAVAKDTIDKLAANAEAALKGHENDEGGAIRSIIGACSSWTQKFPHYHALVGYAEFSQRVVVGQRPDSLQARLEGVLADWARTPRQDGKIAPLSSAQLYAVIIAPAICDVRFPVIRPSTKSNIDWIDSLSRAALVALQPLKRKSA
jgi:AcrR family transcriptional regulator